jgi:hypothetical protein
MLNYSDRMACLMRDIVARVPALSYINMSEVLVFGRFGRADAEGAFATCHSLNLPPSEPGYYFWRDRRTGRLTRRSEWFVTKSPTVQIGRQPINYLISFALPRFCDQTLEGSRKHEFYPGAEPWLAKLDTVVHELYHIDPQQPGIRRVERADGSYSHYSHSPDFFEQVTRMVNEYLAARPDPAVYDFLKFRFADLVARYGGVVATTFRSFPSYPQRYLEVLSVQPPLRTEDRGVKVERLKHLPRQTCYSEADLRVRQFLSRRAPQIVRGGQTLAA